ncbi:putative carboxylesterase hlo [Aspergillus cavernicola]|uniref:Carboxylesterase hlo n=1 Tax=Aspergillus cavernicola TaxID=176166 RepID=A0ABR4IJ41_9EURO
MLLLLSFAAAVAAAACTPTYNSRPTAIIDSGAIVGTTTKVAVPSATMTVNKYLGIPYAEEPERFRLPKPVAPWIEFFDASDYGKACYQQISNSTAIYYEGANLGVVPNGESEDCLNLNVYTPATASAGSKPVIVWIHGGSWRNGAGSLPLYDGSSFVANQDIVLVSINYRTNVFGFVGDENVPVTERNLALHDSRLALEWVVRNIAGLGGDPSKITLMGESSGAQTIDTILTAPPAGQPQFRAAILTSSQIAVPSTLHSSDAYVEAWAALTELAGCPAHSTFECLQEYPAQELVDLANANNLSYPGFTDGGVTWADTPRLDRLAGKTANVPVLIGTTYDEASTYTVGLNDTRAALEQIGIAEYADLILQAYPLGTPGILTETARINRIVSEFGLQCSAQVWANDTKNIGLPTWRFVYNASFPNTEYFPGAGAYHASELATVFGTYRQENATDFQHEVSRTMQKAYGDFAKNPYAGPGWAQAPTVGIFGNGITPYVSAEGKKALTTLPSSVVDVRCPLYYSLYDANSLGVAEEE